MEEEQEIPKKIIIDCNAAALLTTIKEAGDITFYQRLQLLYHNLGCSLCRLWGKHSARITKMMRSAFEGDEHKMPETAKEKMEKEIDDLFV